MSAEEVAELAQEEVGESGEEFEGESEEDLPEIILPTTSDIQRPGVANYLQTPIQLGARPGLTNKTRNKTSVLELDIDQLEDKPWQKPGVDISQYFNYGFNEDTWKQYCQRQHQMKMESQNLGKISVYESSREPEERPSVRSQISKPEFIPSYHPEEESAAIELVGNTDHHEKFHSYGNKPAPSKSNYPDDHRDDRDRDRSSRGGARRREHSSREEPYSRPRDRERDYDPYRDDRDRGYDRHRDHRDPRDGSSRDYRDSRDQRDRDERRGKR